MLVPIVWKVRFAKTVRKRFFPRKVVFLWSVWGGRQGHRSHHSPCLHSPATPGAAVRASAEAPRDDGEQSGGDAMEVCSEHAASLPEPVGERRTSSHRSVPGILLRQVVSVCFVRRMLGWALGSSLPERRELECWLQQELRARPVLFLSSHFVSCARPVLGPEAQEGKAPSPPLHRGLNWDGRNVGCRCRSYDLLICFSIANCVLIGLNLFSSLILGRTQDRRKEIANKCKPIRR